MDTVRITRDWRVTIPPKYRELLHIRPGQKADVTVGEGGIIRIEFLPFEDKSPAADEPKPPELKRSLAVRRASK
jgi:AbrB family looped-hinge helix DNA binding protein